MRKIFASLSINKNIGNSIHDSKVDVVYTKEFATNVMDTITIYFVRINITDSNTSRFLRKSSLLLLDAFKLVYIRTTLSSVYHKNNPFSSYESASSSVLISR